MVASFEPAASAALRTVRHARQLWPVNPRRFERVWCNPFTFTTRRGPDYATLRGAPAPISIHVSSKRRDVRTEARSVTAK